MCTIIVDKKYFVHLHHAIRKDTGHIAQIPWKSPPPQKEQNVHG